MASISNILFMDLYVIINKLTSLVCYLSFLQLQFFAIVSHLCFVCFFISCHVVFKSFVIFIDMQSVVSQIVNV